MRGIKLVLLSLLMVSLVAVPAFAGTVSGSKHDFTESIADRDYTGLDESANAVCQACHVPHNADSDTLIFADAGSKYGNESSEVSTNSSVMCMSCHDGTLASGDAGGTDMGDASYNLGTDLSDDHPVDVVYDANSASGDKAGLIDKTSLPSNIQSGLTENDEITCGSCHDPHDNETTATDGSTKMFLEVDPNEEDICLQCHANK